MNPNFVATDGDVVEVFENMLQELWEKIGDNVLLGASLYGVNNVTNITIEYAVDVPLVVRVRFETQDEATRPSEPDGVLRILEELNVHVQPFLQVVAAGLPFTRTQAKVGYSHDGRFFFGFSIVPPFEEVLIMAMAAALQEEE